MSTIFRGGGFWGGVNPPKLMAGKMILPPYMMHNNGSLVLTAARYYIAPFAILPGQTFAGVAFKNSGAGDNGKKVKIAFYSEATNGGPGALAKDFGESTLTGASALRTLASAWVPPVPGIYYGELVSDTTPTLYTMTALAQDTAAGFFRTEPLTALMGGFAADVLGVLNDTNEVLGDYVAGTYANFPEATSLTPTNTIIGNNSSFPCFGLYA